MRYNLTDLSSLPLPGSELAAVMSEAWDKANDPDCEISDCPYGPSADKRMRAYRIAWRTVFRRMRERRVQLVTEMNVMAGFQVAA